MNADGSPLRAEETADGEDEVVVLVAGRQVLVRVGSPLDVLTAPRLRGKLEALPSRIRRAIVDLRGCEFVDSEGVRTLWRLHLALQERCGELRLVVLPGSRVLRTFRLLRLDCQFRIYATTVEAWIHGRRRALNPGSELRSRH